MIFIIRNSNYLTSVAAFVTALLLVVGMGFGLNPEIVSAEEYASTEETAEENTEVERLPDMVVQDQAHSTTMTAPYALYEQLTPAQRAYYVRLQQLQQKRQQWLQNRLPYTEPRDLEAEAAAAAAAAAAETARIAAENHARMSAEKARVEEERQKIWHNPLVVDTYVSSRYGMRRHPVYKTWRMHHGVDLDSDRGDLIRASRGGVVIAAGWHDSYGYYVRIDHGDGFTSEYFHMKKYYVKKGQEVTYCEPIGEVGSTGVSTGSHLHFGIRYNGQYVDPEDYIDFRA